MEVAERQRAQEGLQIALAAHQAQLHHRLETAYNELRQTQQAVMQQDRLRALGQMASGIAHDINNALSPPTCPWWWGPKVSCARR